MALKACTINVNGFRKKHRPPLLFYTMEERGIDVIFLQETHITNPREAKNCARLWKGRHFWSFGTNRARGCGILLAKDLDYTFVAQQHDSDGRLVVVDIDMNGHQYRLINVYAPNNPAERRIFLNRLEVYLAVGRDCVIGGDWNFVEDVNLDRQGISTYVGDAGKKEMKSLRDDFFLIDAFRARQPNCKKFSFRTGASSGRLDRWYVADHMRPWLDSVTYEPCPWSDHYYVFFDF